METPSLDDYLRLRIEAGLTPKRRDAAERGLPQTWFGVVVRYQDRAVAMGRIIGDGGLFFQVCDMAVEPAHQGKGLGKAVMARLMQELRYRASGAYVSLIADGQANQLYAQYGFLPTTPKSIGMAQILP